MGKALVETRISKPHPRYVSAVATVAGSRSPYDDKFKMKAVVRSVARSLKLPPKSASVSRSFISGRISGHLRVAELPMSKKKIGLLRRARILLNKRVSAIDWNDHPFLEGRA